ncbi:hypothetical protein M9H77_16324 [Catharanthus roseus]|uniref:Uncharacterized protein n=1 Tax=Catharanthus roseus TaxID=4058 RepID=A0ACC0B1G6_CATRO|nr:hypothetical protein M9H77_16324 [Catharanthus roseus]
MKVSNLFFQFFLLLNFIIISTVVVSAKSYKIPRLSRPSITPSSYSVSLDDFQTYFYEQTLDHFNYGPQSYQSFNQKYVMSTKYWGGANSSSPIFVHLGAEAPLNNSFLKSGFLNDHLAPRFKALIVYIEHRFYGESAPLGSMEEAMKNQSIRGCFNSAQALADYAHLLLHIKQKLSSPNSPIFAVGGSYGGMLAAWFRLKYPHIAMGALASSAPLLYFDNITPQDGYYSTVTKDFKEVSKSCYRTIKKGWSIIDRVASSTPNGLFILSQRFNTCQNLSKAIVLKDFLNDIYSVAAQYDEPPDYPVSKICGAIDGDGASSYSSDILGRISAGVAAAFAGQNMSCYDVKYFDHLTQTRLGWRWQTCSEMVMPIGRDSNDTMFESEPFDLKDFMDGCNTEYGVVPRPHWITTNYGGHDMKMVLKKFGSNIIFSNGLRDPYSSAGVLEDLSDSLLAIYTLKGSHCLDLRTPRADDPVWLVTQRKIEADIINGWIATYYADLHMIINREHRT